MLKILERGVLAVMLAAILLWCGDWAMFAVRAARGTSYDTVTVQQFLSTALKGNKQEYDYMGTMQETCARSVFPHGGAPACWWLRRHTTQWE
ncbi:MAG TPA: hypothetical protein VHX13_13920 [Acidobacteriaceae bacterium]|nr:hypothetical protein [Acidobacteriaceae bacterium]